MVHPQPSHDDPHSKIVAFKEAQARARSKAKPTLDPEQEKRRVRSNIAALVFAGFLIAVGWLLVQKLGQSARMQDCLMSGRTNCAPIATPPTD